MGQPRAIMITLVIDEDLGLVLEPAERGRVDDPVAVALKRRAHRMFRLRMKPAATFLGFRRVGRAGHRPFHAPTSIALNCVSFFSNGESWPRTLGEPRLVGQR